MTVAAAPKGFVVEIEQDVLGAFLMSSECVARVKSFLREDHFREDIHRLIYRAILTTFERYRAVNLVVVSKVADPTLDAAVQHHLGMKLSAYLANLASGTMTSPASIRDRTKVLIEQWARLSVAEEAGRIQAAATDPGSSVGEIVSAAGQTFDDIMADVRSGPTRKSRVLLSSAVESAFQSAREARERGAGLTGLTWGLSDLNRLTGGMQKRDLTLVGARPSMGKTTFAMGVALRAAKAGHGVVFLSLEMDREKLAARAASDLAYDWAVKVPYVDIIRGNVSEDDLGKISAAARDISTLPIWIDDQAGITLSDIRTKVEAGMRAADEAGFTLDVLMVDHLGLIRASSRYSGNRTNEIAELTGGLKSLAREFDLAVVLLSQLNRGLEQRPDKRPQLSDLRDSGAIEQDADTILFLHREAYYLERDKSGTPEAQADRFEKLIDAQHVMEVEVAKQRNGPIKRIEMFADMGFAAVRNAVQHR